MKLNKKQAGLIAGVVCVILLIILLLTMCRGSGGQNEPSLPPETSMPTVADTQPVTETTEAEEETTEATEETTEVTEETTEETTKPTTGGNTSPGGTGYYPSTGGNNNSTGNQEATTETIPAAGSEGSPYAEVVAALPDSFKTVAIPVDSTIYHNLDIASASVLTIEDASAYVIYNDIKYEADENGIVSLTLAAAEEDAPVSIQVGNKNVEEKAFSLQFSAPVGSSQNPDVLTDAETVEDGKWSKTLDVSLAAGNEEGYHYQYTAAEVGTLSFDLESVTEGTDCDILITVGENTVNMSESTDGIVSVNLQKDDVAMVQIVAVPDEEGAYPAVDATVNCTLIYPEGSVNNPIPVDELTSVQIDALAPDEMIYYCAENIKGAKLLIQDANAFIQIGKDKYTATSNRVLVEIITADKVVFAVGNTAETTKNFVMQINHSEGSKLRPKTLYINTATSGVFEQDYYYAWTATGNGKMTVTINTQLSENWSFQINNTTTGEQKDVHSSVDDPVVSSDVIGFSKGDVIQVVVKGTINFTAKPSKKDATAVSDAILQLGENVLKTISSATTTVYKFTPSEIGTYIFETDGGTLSYWGSSVEGMANATTEETLVLTQATTTEDESILIGVTGSLNCNLTITKTVTYGTDATPTAYAVILSENQQFVTMDLSQKYELQLDEESGFYHIAEGGPVVLVDFTSDTFVNLAKLMETNELYCEITAEDGTVTRETYNTLLQKYIAGAAGIKISETETKTLYPLTEDLRYILKNVGDQLGWYDSTASGSYLFENVAEPEADSLWMFSCCSVQTVEQTANSVDEEQTETTTETEETTQSETDTVDSEDSTTETKATTQTETTPEETT